uniref:Class I SAM-dependent methyltransferase n=1 Tax=Fundidesulfovibrio putealis TaxID=270496 RepID=A0A7C4AHU1_9BACT
MSSDDLLKLRQVLVDNDSVRYVNGRLGGDSAVSLEPESFDAVCSTSVLEEVPMTAMPGLVQHAARLLRPGGFFLGTFDSPIGHTYYPEMFFAILREAGLACMDVRPMFSTSSAFMLNPARYDVDTSQAALENPPLSMLYYQHADGEDRRYCGHWTTLFFVARKQEPEAADPSH